MKALLALVTSIALAAAPAAWAQKWPDKPVRFIVPYPPGGNVDVAARIVADGLQKASGA